MSVCWEQKQQPRWQGYGIPEGLVSSLRGVDAFRHVLLNSPSPSETTPSEAEQLNPELQPTHHWRPFPESTYFHEMLGNTSTEGSAPGIRVRTPWFGCDGTAVHSLLEPALQCLHELWSFTQGHTVWSQRLGLPCVNQEPRGISYLLVTDLDADLQDMGVRLSEGLLSPIRGPVMCMEQRSRCRSIWSSCPNWSPVTLFPVTGNQGGGSPPLSAPSDGDLAPNSCSVVHTRCGHPSLTCNISL